MISEKKPLSEKVLPGLPGSGEQKEEQGNPALKELLGQMGIVTPTNVQDDTSKDNETKEYKEGEHILNLLNGSMALREDKVLLWAAMFHSFLKYARKNGIKIDMLGVENGPLKNRDKLKPYLEDVIKNPNTAFDQDEFVRMFLVQTNLAEKLYETMNYGIKTGDLDKRKFIDDIHKNFGNSLPIHLLEWVLAGRRIFHVPDNLLEKFNSPIENLDRECTDVLMPFESFCIEFASAINFGGAMIRGVNVVFDKDNGDLQILCLVDETIKDLKGRSVEPLFDSTARRILNKIANGKVSLNKALDKVHKIAESTSGSNYSVRHFELRIKGGGRSISNIISDISKVHSQFGDGILKIVINLSDYLAGGKGENRTNINELDLLVGGGSSQERGHHQGVAIESREYGTSSRNGLFDLGRVHNLADKRTINELRQMINNREVSPHMRRSHLVSQRDPMLHAVDGSHSVFRRKNFVGPLKERVPRKGSVVRADKLGNGSIIPTTVSKLKPNNDEN